MKRALPLLAVLVGAAGCYDFQTALEQYCEAPCGDGGVETSGFTFTAQPSSLTLARGASAPVVLTLSRTGDFRETVTFALEAPAAGVSALPVSRDANEPAVSLSLVVASDAPLGVVALTVLGQAQSVERRLPISLTIPRLTQTVH